MKMLIRGSRSRHSESDIRSGGFAAMARRGAAFAGAMLVIAGMAATADAQIVRNFTSRYSTTDRGNYLFVGNTLMTCPDASSSCAAARTQGGSLTNNQDFTMVAVDVDPAEPGANSSSATLTLPAGSTVKYAALYWGATSSSAARNIARLRTPAGSTYSTITAGQLDVSGTAYHAFSDVTSLVTAAGSGVYTVADAKPSNTVTL
jgi:large repetitive protein